MSYGTNPPVLAIWEEFALAGDAMKTVPMALANYIPYIFGMGILNWAGDWLKEARPISYSETTDNFFKHTFEGVVDVAKFSYWGAYPTAPPGGRMPAALPYHYTSYPSMTGWGSTSMHGMANPGVNRVSGQY